MLRTMERVSLKIPETRAKVGWNGATGSQPFLKEVIMTAIGINWPNCVVSDIGIECGLSRKLSWLRNCSSNLERIRSTGRISDMCGIPSYHLDQTREIT